MTFDVLAEKRFRAGIKSITISGNAEDTSIDIRLAAPLESVDGSILVAWLAEIKHAGVDCEIVVRAPRNPQLALFADIEGVMTQDLAAIEAEYAPGAEGEPEDLPARVTRQLS